MNKRFSTYQLFALLSGCCLAATSCSKTPDGVLKEKKMQYVQRDMVMAEGMISQNPSEYDTQEKKEALYKSVFKKHNTTEAEYDSSLMWYGKNLDIYMKVIDRISDDLKAIDKQVQEELKIVPQGPTRTDSVDIWNKRTNLKFIARDGGNRYAFQIKPTSQYPSGSSFVFAAKVYGVSPKMNEYPILKISADQTDTIVSVRDTIKEDGIVKLILKTIPTKQIRSVFGNISISGNDTIDYKIMMDSINVYRYNYGKLPEETTVPTLTEEEEIPAL